MNDMKLSDRSSGLLEKLVGEAMTLGELEYRHRLTRGTIESIEAMARRESLALRQGQRNLPASDLAIIRIVNGEYRKQLKNRLKIERDDLETIQTMIELTKVRLAKTQNRLGAS